MATSTTVRTRSNTSRWVSESSRSESKICSPCRRRGGSWWWLAKTEGGGKQNTQTRGERTREGRGGHLKHDAGVGDGRARAQQHHGRQQLLGVDGVGLVAVERGEEGREVE